MLRNGKIIRLFVAAMSLAGMGIAGDLRPARASVVVNGTRIIYPAEKREVNIRMENTGPMPALVQAWIDAGDRDAGPGEAQVPFTLAPPLFRIDPKTGQSLRLLYTLEPLPTDRETLFWLNILDIPPTPKAQPAAPNQLQLAFRHRLKLFFRPKGLPGDAKNAPARLKWTLEPMGGNSVLRAYNPTPFHVSLVTLALGAGTANATLAPDMVAPFSAADFALPEDAARFAGPIRVSFRFVNDFGGIAAGDALIHGAD